MATIAFGDSTATTVGDLPAKGDKIPAFTLVNTDLAETGSADLTGPTVISIFPSIGTGVCQASVRRFNEIAAGREGTTVLNVSMDLPFALKGFCAAEGLENVAVASGFRSTFGQDFVDAHVGGSGPHRSSLTPVARELVARFLALRERMRELVEEEFARLAAAGAARPQV